MKNKNSNKNLKKIISRFAFCNKLTDQGGVALVVTLLIMTLLISLTVEFTHDVYLGSSALSNWSNAQKASLIAKSGQNLSADFIKRIKSFSYTYPGEISFPVLIDFGPDSFLSIKIEDENAKFNINTVIYDNGLTNEEALSSLKKLFEYLNIKPSLALVMADWIDPDHEPRVRDSEYNANNSFFLSIDELRLIKGMDKDTFEKINPYLTVHDGDGSKKININTAKIPVLVSLHENMTVTLAKKIIVYRESTPFENESHLQRVSGMETTGQLLIGKITVKSSTFRVSSTAVVNEISRVIESVMDHSLKVLYWREG